MFKNSQNMKAESISYSNVKGTDGHYALTGVNLVSGPNFSGKSAFLSAIKIHLWGHDLELGKQHKATMLLAAESRPEMTTAMVIDTQASMKSWKRKGEGEVKFTETGEVPELPAILMDMDEFLGPKKTEQDRINYVFARISDADIGFSDDDLIARITALEAVPVKPAEAARGKLLDFITKSIANRKRDKMKIQTWLDYLLTKIKEMKKEADDNHKSTAATLIPLKPTGPAPKDQSAEIKTKQENRALIASQIADLKSRQQMHETALKHIAEIDAQLALPTEDTSALMAELEKLKAENAAYKSQTKALADKLSRLRERAKAIKEEKEKLSAEEAALKQFIALNKCSNPGCPFGQGYEADHGKLLVAMGEKAEEYSKTVKEGEKLKADHAASEKKDAAHASITTRIAALEHELTSKRFLTEGARQQLLAERSKIVQGEPVPPEAISALQSKIDALDAELATLAALQREFDQRAGNQKTLLTLEQKILEYTAESAILLLAKDVVSEIQQQILEHAFTPLLEKARPFTDSLLTPAKNGIEYRNGSLGMATDAGWVPIKLFSDSQKAISFAGLAVALAQSSPFKVVFMDEMGKFEHSPRNRKLLVVQRMCDLVRQGVIHAFFGADNRTEDYADIKDPEFTQIILG